MKRTLSIFLAVLMLMQMFTFSVLSEEASMYAYWTGKGPGEITFTTVEGLKRYEIKLYKNEKLVEETSHSLDENSQNTEISHCFMDTIVKNGSGTYRAEVLYADGVSVSTEKYYYKAPSNTLAKPENLEFNQEKNYIVWNSVEGAAVYELNFCLSADGGETFESICSYWIYDTDGTFFDFWGNPADKLGWINEEYGNAMADWDVTAEELIRAIQVVAYPAELNDASPSYSDYVTFDGITIPDSGDDHENIISFDVKKRYSYGESFYAEMWITDANGEYYQAEGWWVENFDPYMSGWQTVTLWYQDYCEMHDVYVAEKSGGSTNETGYIKLVNYQQEYHQGEEFWAEVLVWEQTDDGSMNSYYVDIHDCTVEGFDSYMPGEQNVTIWYGDYCVDCNVTVYGDEDPVLTVFFENIKHEYEYGEEFYLEAYRFDEYGNKSYLSADEWWVEGFDPYTSGWQEVTVFCENNTEIFEVYVGENKNEYVEYVYWSDELPGSINFKIVNGADTYKIKLYKDGVFITESIHSYGSNWWKDEADHSFIKEICSNGSGAYRAEVAVDDGKEKYTASDDYVYKKPDIDLEKPQNVVLHRENLCITWDEVSDVSYYNVCFCYSADDGKSFFMMNSSQVVPEYDGCYYDLQNSIEWIEESYKQKAEYLGISADNLIRAIQIAAFPKDLNYANVSYSDYVTFDAITLPDDGGDEEEPVVTVRFENVKTNYQYGEEFYAEAWLMGADGEYIQAEGWWFENYDPYESGWQTVKLCYEDYYEYYKVYVDEESQNEYLKVNMDNVEFFPGDEFYAEVYVYTADGYCYQVEDYEYEGFDSFNPGEQIVTIRYGNLSTTVTVWVYEEETEPNVIESVYWTGERPAQVYFTFVPGVMTYSIKVLKDDKEIYSDTKDFKRYDRDEGGKYSLRDVVLENGEGIYKVGVAPVFDGFMDTGKYTVSEMLIYREPADILPAVSGVTYNLDTYEIMWNPIEEAAEYDVVFCYSPDGGENFYPVTAYGADEDGYFNFYGDADYEIEWLKDEYESYAEAEGLAVEDLVMAIQIKAFPSDLNNAAPSVSDYVIFREEENVPGIREVRIERLKEQYYQGEEIDAEIWYETEDGRHEFTEDFEVEGYDAYFIGEQHITISFGGYSEDFTVIVKEKPIIDENVTHIRIKSLKALYYIGEEFEAEVYAYRDDGSCYMVEDYLCYDFDSSAEGEQQVEIRYGEFYDVCTVYVYEKELEEDISGTCGDNLTWTLDTNGVLTISGAGALVRDEVTGNMPWEENKGRIKEVIIEDGVTSIGNRVFGWCYGLTNIIIPDSVTEIDDYAFYACTTLPYIRIPDSVTIIGDFAFFECERLENVDFGNGLTTIGAYAFAWCESLTNIYIHSGITNIGYCLFRYCKNLTEITVAEDNPNYCSVDGILFNKDKWYLLSYPIGKRETSYEIPYGVEVIGEAAFDMCTNLTSITIPNTLLSIYEYAFRGCENLTDLYYKGTNAEWNGTSIHETNDSFDNLMFHFEDVPNPEPVYSVTFENVKYDYEIGEAFYVEVYQYTAEGIKTQLEGYEVYGFDSTVAGEQTVTVRYGDYEETFVVYVNGEIEPEPETDWEYDAENRELIIKFNGEMPKYNYDRVTLCSDAPWSYLNEEVERISIWDGVTNISDGAFIGFKNLKEVNLGSTVRRIGASAFEENIGLSYIEIPDSVEYIGQTAFRCSGLETIKFGKNVRTIGAAAFQGSMLTRVELPENLRNIASATFASCNNLFEIYIPSSVQTIQPTAFNYCYELTEVYFGGTEEEWNNIARTSGNAPLYNANIYFNGEMPVKTISIENVKTEYEKGEEFYAEVWVETSDGNRWQLFDYEVEGFDPYETGWQTVIIRVENFEEPFDVYVRGEDEEPYIVNVDFELKDAYYFAGEELNIRVYVHTSDGECNEVFDYEIEGYDRNMVGRQQITVRYKEYSQEFEVFVDKKPNSGGGSSSGGGGGGSAGGSDGTGPVITVSQEKCKAGNTVEVTVSISENTGFANLGLEIEYDRALRLIDVTPNAAVGATFTPAQNFDVYPYNFDFISTGNVNYHGELVTFTFEVPEDTPAGEYYIDVNYYDGRDGNYTDGDNVNFDADGNPLNLRYEGGFVNVYDYIPGDINGNGIVDNKDGTALLRYLAGWTLTDIDENAVDVDGNGMVDNKDGTRLLRYLAGWNVEVH